MCVCVCVCVCWGGGGAGLRDRDRDRETVREEEREGAERQGREREMGRKPDSKRLTERDTGKESKLGRGTMTVQERDLKRREGLQRGKKRPRWTRRQTSRKPSYRDREIEGKRGGETDFSKGRGKETELRQAFLPLFCPQFLAQSSTTSEMHLRG